MLKEFSSLLRHRLSLPLPGRDAQLLMAHAERKLSSSGFRIPQDVLWGSVMILLYEDENKIRIPLILRQTYEGVHSAQIAFPGGKFEAGDENLAFTARRETMEEIGIVANDIEMLGKLTELYIPPSNFLVHPQVGMMNYKPVFIPDETEVKEVIEFSLDDLMDDAIVREKEIRLNNGLRIMTPYFDVKGHTVWGATAMILSELKTIIEEIGGG